MPAQILTTDDLREFKLELLKEFKNMLQQVNINPVDPNQKKFLKSSEVAALLDISLNTLYQLRINRQLPFTKIGGTIFFESSDIEAMMAKNKKQPKMKF
jgi:excisionase family DNA binding protein